MKRFTTLVSALGFVLYMGMSAHAQGKGPGPSSNRGPSANHGSEQSGRAGDNARGHDAKDVKETHQEKDARHETFEARIEQDPQLKARVTALLPAGTDLKTAAEGFKNRGQFIAALHVSKNLNITFDQLKAKMTGDNPESLGKAIHDLRPALSEKDANKEAEKAEKEAKEDEKAPKPLS